MSASSQPDLSSLSATDNIEGNPAISGNVTPVVPLLPATTSSLALSASASTATVTIPLELYESLLQGTVEPSRGETQHFTIVSDSTQATLIPLTSEPADPSDYDCFWIQRSSRSTGSSFNSTPAPVQDSGTSSTLDTIALNSALTNTLHASAMPIPVSKQ